MKLKKCVEDYKCLIFTYLRHVSKYGNIKKEKAKTFICTCLEYIIIFLWI